MQQLESDQYHAYWSSTGHSNSHGQLRHILCSLPWPQKVTQNPGTLMSSGGNMRLNIITDPGCCQTTMNPDKVLRSSSGPGAIITLVAVQATQVSITPLQGGQIVSVRFFTNFSSQIF